ncbi:MAG: hypothetical protein EBZ49_01315 [Proteobacteria bacterium]|nr:hypothetical protein [Pseudomonadota bacterium]
MFINKCKTTESLDEANGRNLQYYLDLTKDYKHDFTFVIKEVEGFKVIDDGEFPYGTKTKMGDFMISQVKEDAMVYVAPRTGFAPYSLTYLAKKYNKKLYLVIPASESASEHQLKAIEEGGIPIFVRIPAMPTANIWAKQFADKVGAKFLPFGLKHESVVAGGVRVFYDNFKDLDIKEMWTVFSTGVLSRTLQIALPNTQFNAVAVARNVQDGELGRAKFYTHDKPFLKESSVFPPFDCIQTYDAKGWELMKKHGKEGDWFWNVARNMPKPSIKPSDINSNRKWGDMSDFEKHY